MDFRKTPITQLIPQRPPFMMVDAVLHCDEVDAVTEFLVREDNVLLEGGQLSAAGVIENMAQSCAARMGCVDVLHGEPIKIGYIGDVRDAEILRLPSCGEVLHTAIHVVEDMFNLLLAEVVVSAEKGEVAKARMKVARTDIVAKLT